MMIFKLCICITLQVALSAVTIDMHAHSLYVQNHFDYVLRYRGVYQCPGR